MILIVRAPAALFDQVKQGFHLVPSISFDLIWEELGVISDIVNFVADLQSVLTWGPVEWVSDWSQVFDKTQFNTEIWMPSFLLNQFREFLVKRWVLFIEIQPI